MSTPDGDDRHRPPSRQRPMPPSIAPRPAPGRPTSPRGAEAAPSEPRTARPAAPASRPQGPAAEPTTRVPSRSRRRRWHPCCTVALVILLAVIGALVWFLIWVSGGIQTVPALSGAPDTPGNTYLIVGSDSRDGTGLEDGTSGARTDTIMVLHRPESGPTALISIPRDSYVEIPGHGSNKINAAFVFGGPELLVETVEGLSGLTMDGYMEVGFTGVAEMVDAVGGVELCYDQDVNDKLSRLTWEAGCHVADGETALAFSRMRYSDPLGDIGRAERQRQVVGAVAEEVMSPSTFLNPFQLVRVTSAGLDAFTFADGTGVFDIAAMALDLNSGLGGQAVTGTPPIADMGYRVDGVGSTVLLDPDLVDQFWEDIETGAYEPGTSVGGVN